MSKITHLKISNFKRIRSVDVDAPRGSVIPVRGENGEGKSSFLDSIAAALGGEKLSPKVPVRRGAIGAHVRVELDDGLIVDRKWTAEGKSSMHLSTRDGARLSRPQGRLDEIVGKLSFDPLRFMELEPRKQAEMLRELAGVDFAALDGKRLRAYQERADANRRVAQWRVHLESMPEVDAPDEPVSPADLIAEQQRMADQYKANCFKRSDLDRVRSEFRDAERKVAQIEHEMEALRRDLDRAMDAREEIRIRGAALKEEVGALQDPDFTEIHAQISDVESLNERVRAKKRRAQIVEELKGAENEAATRNQEIEEIDAEKARLLKEAKFPVEGLSFTADGVLFSGLPFEQASQAEQLRISVAIGAALGPEFRAMLLKDGSRLSEKSLKLLEAEADRLDLQLWIEMVGSEGEGIIIEDGEVEK